MSTSYYGKAFLGFVVDRSDFIETTEAPKATCPAGHEQSGEAAFCPKDGGKFERQKIEKAKPALEAIHEYFEWSLGDNVEVDYRALFDEEGPLCSFEGVSWYSNDKTETRAAGMLLSEVSYNGGTLQIHDLAELQTNVAEVEKLRAALKMNDRPIQLFHHIRAC